MAARATEVGSTTIAVPTMGRAPVWASVISPGIFAVFFIGGLTNPKGNHSPAFGAFLIVWFLAALVGGINGRTSSVTLTGRTVEVRGRLTRTRFELADVRWVVDPVLDSHGPLRVDGAEQWVLGWRRPRLVPWPELVPTSVHPSFWVRHAGIPEARVRGGGLTRWRRGLR